MAEAEKPQMPETPDQTSETIKPLKLKAVNGFRARIGAIFKKIGKVLAPAVLAAHLGGDFVQDKFRDSIGYNPDKPVPADAGGGGKRKEGLEPTSQEAEPPQEPVAEEEKGLLEKLTERAAEGLRKANEAVKKKYESVRDRSELVKKYRESAQDMKDAYYALLNAVDKGAYWGPFLLLFLATALLSNKLLGMKKNLTETVDPQVEQNMKDIEAKVNELVEAINNKQTPNMDEVKALVEEFKKNSAGLEEGVDESILD